MQKKNFGIITIIILVVLTICSGSPLSASSVPDNNCAGCAAQAGYIHITITGN